MKLRDHICIYWICQIFSTALFAQQVPIKAHVELCPMDTSISHYHFRWFDEHNGLPSHRINSKRLLVDPSGYLWISTPGGVVRFDGHKFQIHFSDPNDKNTPVITVADVISGGDDGTIWVASHHGFSGYDPISETWKQYIPKSTGYQISGVHQDSKNRVWVYGDSTGLSRLKDDSLYQVFFSDSTKRSLGLGTEFPPRSGRIWATKYMGFATWSADDASDYEEYDLDFIDGRRVSIHSVISDTVRNGIWLGTWGNGLLFYQPDKQKLIAYQFDPPGGGFTNYCTGIAWKSDHEIWVTTQHGLGIFNIKNSSFSFTGIHPGEITKVPDYLSSIAVTKQGDVWVGSRSGLGFLNTDAQYTRWIDLPHKYAAERDYFRVTEIIWDSVSSTYLVFAMGADGLYRLNEKFELLEVISNGDPTRDMASVIEAAVDSAQQIFMLKRTADWQHYALYKLDRTNWTTEIVADPIMGSWYDLVSDGRDGFWLGALGRIGHWNPSEGFRVVFSQGDSTGPRLDATGVFRFLHRDKQGKLWYASSNGLTRFDPWDKNDQGEFIKFEGNDKGVLLHHDITSIAESPDGSIWLSTLNGIQVFDPFKAFSEQKRTSWTAPDGPPQPEVFGLYADSEGKIWSMTMSGLACYDPVADLWSRFTIEEGFPASRIGFGILIGKHEELLLRTKRGLLYVDGKWASFQQNPAKVFLESVRTYGAKERIYYTHGIPGKIVLKHNENFVDFELLTIEYRRPNSIQFRWQLEGVDPAWVEGGRRRFTSYADLRPGNYRFKCAASNGSSIWGPEQTVDIFIKTPWFSSLSFYLTLAVLTLIAIYLLFQWRMAKINAVANLRERIARDLHDDLGATLSSIQMLAEMASVEEATDQDKMSAITTQSREMIDAMDDIVWAVKPGNDKIADLKKRMERLLAERCGLAEINYNLEVTDDAEIRQLALDTRRDLYLIFKEAVNNAVKHGSPSEIKVWISILKNQLVLKIEDDGKGFTYTDSDIAVSSSQNQASGNGLINIKSRAESRGGTLQLSSKKGKGTIVIVHFPL